MTLVKDRLDWVQSIRLGFADLIALILSLLSAAIIRGLETSSILFSPVTMALVILICWFGILVIGGYDSRQDMVSLRYASEHLLTMIAVSAAAFIVTYTVTTFDVSLKPSRLGLTMTLVIFGFASLLYRRFFSYRIHERQSTLPIYVIGSHPTVIQIKELNNERSRFPIVGIPVVQTKEFLQALLEDLSENPTGQRKCEAVVIDLQAVTLDNKLEELIVELNLKAVPVYPVETYMEVYFQKVDCSRVSLQHALDGTFRPDHHSPYGNLKKGIDVVFAASLILLFSPIMLGIAVAIKLQDGGPILFKQVRVGRFEVPFLIYKFRTMTTVHSEKEDVYTQKHDQRVTRFGRMLRLTRLDELPQLWNVLLGHMSVIGPRAEWDKLVTEYSEKIRFYNLRFMVKPGITGWAQVNYGYGAGLSDAVEKLKYDLYYIKHYSPEMDAGIVLKTVYIILSASGR